MNYAMHLRLALATQSAGVPPRDDPEPAAPVLDDLVAAVVQGTLGVGVVHGASPALAGRAAHLRGRRG